MRTQSVSAESWPILPQDRNDLRVGVVQKFRIAPTRIREERDLPMANNEQLMILGQGVGAWNRWRADHRVAETDLSNADLSGANLSLRRGGVDFNGTSLRGTNLSGTALYYAELNGADLSGADLSDAALNSAQIRHAKLVGAKLMKADLSYAIVTDSDLSGADFSGAFMWATTLADVDLSTVKGLDRVRHETGSTIGLDTIYKSKGNISKAFLRNCGVPESFIVQVQSLMRAEDGIQFHSCFISYSSKDEEFARRLHGRMRDAHLRVWFAPEDMKSGAKLHEQIETAIRTYDKLLVVLSAASLQSEWVITELRNARKAERESGKRKLFPLLLVDFKTLRDWECFDADTGKDLAIELREYFIPDFTRWKEDDQFETSFSRLLKDLQAP